MSETKPPTTENAPASASPAQGPAQAPEPPPSAPLTPEQGPPTPPPVPPGDSASEWKAFAIDPQGNRAPVKLNAANRIVWAEGSDAVTQNSWVKGLSAEERKQIRTALATANPAPAAEASGAFAEMPLPSVPDAAAIRPPGIEATSAEMTGGDGWADDADAGDDAPVVHVAGCRHHAIEQAKRKCGCGASLTPAMEKDEAEQMADGMITVINMFAPAARPLSDVERVSMVKSAPVFAKYMGVVGAYMPEMVAAQVLYKVIATRAKPGCARCGEPHVASDQRYCSGCGVSQLAADDPEAPRCGVTSCGARILPGASHCIACGTKRRVQSKKEAPRETPAP